MIEAYGCSGLGLPPSVCVTTINDCALSSQRYRRLLMPLCGNLALNLNDCPCEHALALASELPYTASFPFRAVRLHATWIRRGFPQISLT
jgi:hypothetical protein